MTRTLILLRHAKSDHDDPTLTDLERPLNERGRRDAPRMAAFLEDKGLIPDQIVSSIAIRTRETLRAIVTKWTVKPPAKFNSDLYEATAGMLVNIAENELAEAQCLMIVGHNPSIEFAVRHFTGQTVPMPTCAADVIEFSDDIAAETGKLLNVYRPKEVL